MGLSAMLGGLIGSATATGISETLDGVGKAAINIRSAVTGQLPPEKAADLEMHLADIDAKIAEAQNKVNEIEAGSASFFVAGWRPAVGWCGVLGLIYSVLLQPMLAWYSTMLRITAPPMIDSGALITLLGVILGIGSMRSYEKFKGVHQEH